MISASKITLSLNNLNILRPKGTKNLMNLRKKFRESPLWFSDESPGLTIRMRILIQPSPIDEPLNGKKK